MKQQAKRVAVSVVTTAVTVVLLAGPAMAQVPNPNPDGTMPGAALMTKALGWVKYASLGAAVGGVICGAIAAGVGHWGQHGGAAQAARKWMLGGFGAAALAGLAFPLVNALYASASAG